jgi:hypothetical protein
VKPSPPPLVFFIRDSPYDTKQSEHENGLTARGYPHRPAQLRRPPCRPPADPAAAAAGRAPPPRPRPRRHRPAPAVATKVLGWPKRCKSARAFLWEYSYKKLKLAQLLGQLDVFVVFLARGAWPRVTRRSAWQAALADHAGPVCKRWARWTASTWDEIPPNGLFYGVAAARHERTILS